MSENDPKPLAQVVDAVIDVVVARCDDPRAAEFKRQFDAAAAEVRQRFDDWRWTTLADRKAYHETCGLVGAEADRAAEADVALLAGAATEQREQLIGHHWSVFLRRLQAVLEEVQEQE
ncbi:hypothetical protein [Zavarzinella formosa]|uniref:hypothetical protein n=1 Tax=Zavarzinella formosa TaxID=360055 RepID=UPI0004962D88|nr:hypothetical protein [Zavarzinella formosa]